MTCRTAIALAALLLLPVLPLAGAEEEPVRRARYVLAIGMPDPLDWGPRCTRLPPLHLTGGSILLGPFGEVDVPETWTEEATAWGACFEDAAGTRVVRVVDDAGATPPYRWTVSGDPACYAKGEAVGTATVEVPAACPDLDVMPFAGTLAGTIEVR